MKCPKCGQHMFPGTGEHTIDVRSVAPGISFGVIVWDQRPRGPKLIDIGTQHTPDYYVCQSCGHDWEEPHVLTARQ
jgi:hypothetical protein